MEEVWEGGASGFGSSWFLGAFLVVKEGTDTSGPGSEGATGRRQTRRKRNTPTMTMDVMAIGRAGFRFGRLCEDVVTMGMGGSSD